MGNNKNKNLNKYLLNKKKNQEKILVAFLPALYPDKESSFKLINYLLNNGVDALELGFPVLNARKDGETIKKANQKVIENGFNDSEYIELAAEVNQKQEYNRITVMTYWEIIKDDFVKKYQYRWKKAGIKNLIFPDLKNKADFEFLRKSPYNLVPFLDSVEKINNFEAAEEAFIYCPTHKGKTGTDNDFDLKLLVDLKKALNNSDLVSKPHLAGFGISSAADVNQIIELGYDGVIIGSEFINKIDQGFDVLKGYLEELKIILDKE